MINLIDLLGLKGITLEKYKIHLATGSNPPPIEAFFEGRFKEWQEDQNNRNFECPMVLALISLGSDKWLFAGVYNVLGVGPGLRTPFKYDTELLLGQADLIGRIIVKYKRPSRASYIWGYKFGSELEVSEILESRLSIELFPGYNNVLLSQSKLKLIQSKEEASWKAALSSVGGIYLIVDTLTGKNYVGSAIGEGGFWQRWRAYSETGHGDNKDLKALIKDKGPQYSRNFQLAILEITDLQASVEYIIGRENHWKEVLMSREFGYNSN